MPDRFHLLWYRAPHWPHWSLQICGEKPYPHCHLHTSSPWSKESDSKDSTDSVAHCGRKLSFRWAKFLITQHVTSQLEPDPLKPQCDGIWRPIEHPPFELEWKPSSIVCSSPTQTHIKDLKTNRLAHPAIVVLGACLRIGGWNLGEEGRPGYARGLCVLTAFFHSSFLCGWLFCFLKIRASLLTVGKTADFYMKERQYDKERVLESSGCVLNSSYNILSSKVLGKLPRYFLVSISQYEGLGW